MGTGIQAIIWDMGGVLLRTENRQPRNELAQSVDISYKELDQLVFASASALQAEIGAIEDKEHWQNVASVLSLSSTDLPQFIENFWSGDELDLQLLGWISSLRNQHKIGLLSNAWKGTRATLLTKYPQFLDPFHAAIFSAEVGIRKPAAQIFALILEKLNVEADKALFVDDFAANIDGAHAAGLQVVQFLNREQVIKEISTLLQGEQHAKMAG
ncbi:MAG TPA: HAD family phosphatase [Anaerolineaceae bacterium]|nr:HAD family phosphatase [Anaerolineaceae bacterium]